MKKEVLEMEGAIEKEREKEGGDRDTSVEDDDPSEGDQEAVFAKTPFFTYAGHAADLLDISWSKVSHLCPCCVTIHCYSFGRWHVTIGALNT